MRYPVEISSSIAALLLLVGVVSPALAHKVEVSGTVAGLWHVEPNHSPKAGEPAQVWVALTRQGGNIIPLEQCNCKLSVYSKSTTDGATPVLEPTLKAIAAEQYQGIPGAEVVFPEAGEYELRLSGTPQAGADFEPFELSYAVLIGVGAPSPPASMQEEPTSSRIQPTQQAAAPQPWIAPAITATGLGLLGLVGWSLYQSKGRKRNP